MRIRFWIPGAIFAVLAAIAAVLTLFEPETIGRPLPTTVEEIEGWTITLTEEEKIRHKEKTFLMLWKGTPNPAFVPDEEPANGRAVSVTGQESGPEPANGRAVSVIGQESGLEPANGKALGVAVTNGQKSVFQADVTLKKHEDHIVYRL